MCAPKVKTPKVEKVPIFQSSVMPDGGDPTVRSAIRGQRRLMRSAMIFNTSASGSLGSSVAAVGDR